MKSKLTIIQVSQPTFLLMFLIALLVQTGVTLAQPGGGNLPAGAFLKIASGSSLVCLGDMNIGTGAVIENSGTLVLKKDLNNENESPNSLGNGLTELSGSGIQQINGQNIFQLLTVNNITEIGIGGNTIVNGTLTLTSGIISLGNFNLLLGPLSSIAGSPSSTTMIVPTGTGELRKEFVPGFNGTYIFPVGDNNGAFDYSPVTLNFIQGVFATGNHVGVSLKNEKHPDPNISGNYLNRYWKITQSGITEFTCDMSFKYVAADVVGSESELSCTKAEPLPWVNYGLTNTTSHTLSGLGIVSFSSFTGVKTDKPTENQQLANIGIPSGVTYCYDATQVLTVAGSGTTFQVENGGNITLVAGSSIKLMDGTSVISGGQFHAYITTDNSYCSALLNPLIANVIKDDEPLGFEVNEESHFIKVYPNPSTDLVVVELVGSTAELPALITVYNMQGSKLIQKTLDGGSRLQFSLFGKPVGMYIVHVQAGDQFEIAKVVKK